MPWRLHSQLSTLKVDNEVPVPVGSNTLCSVYSLVSLHAILAVRAHSSTQIPKPRQYDRYANNYPRYNAG